MVPHRCGRTGEGPSPGECGMQSSLKIQEGSKLLRSQVDLNSSAPDGPKATRAPREDVLQLQT